MFTAAACLVILIILTARRTYLRSQARLKFESSHQLRVGWTQRKYAVRIEEVDALIEDLIDRVDHAYPLARQALVGCTIVFREPTWVQWRRFRRVEGEQDGMFLTVGWKSELDNSALQHELAHRILQVCAGDPSEDVAHEMLVHLQIQ